MSPSTVRSELAELESLGLLTHPHTSAGRDPDRARLPLLRRASCSSGRSRGRARFPLDLTSMRSEVEAALQSTTEMLSQVTRLLALVSAPGLETATVRHVEVLLLQPSVVMVVTITSTGGVAKKLVTFERAGRPGPRGLGERVPERAARRRRARHAPAAQAVRRPEPLGAGARLPRRAAPGVRRARDARRRSRSTSAAPHRCSTTCAPTSSRPAGACSSVLEKRAAVLELMSDAFDARRPFVRVGLDHPGAARRRARRRDLRPADPDARHGRPARPGADGLRQGGPHGAGSRARALAPRRGGVRRAADRAGYACPMATAERDYYELLGVERDATEAEIKKAFRKLARELHPDVSQEPDAQERFRAVAEAYEVLSKAETRQLYDRYGARGPAARRLHAERLRLLEPDGHLLRLLRRRPVRRATAAARARGGDVGVSVEIELAEAFTGVTRTRRGRGRGDLRALRRRGRRAGDGARHLRDLRRPRTAAAGLAQRLRRVRAHADLPDVRRRRPRRRDAVHGVRGRRPHARADGARGRDPGRESTTASGSASAGAGHAGANGGLPGDAYVEVRVARDARFERDGDDILSQVDLTIVQAALGATLSVPTLDGERELDFEPGHAAGRGAGAARQGDAVARSAPARRPPRARQRRGARAT